MVNKMENYLIHHGIKGQRWGIRRYQNPDGTLTEAGKRKKNKENIQNENKDRRDASKNVKLLSDDELNKRIERMRKEKQLRDMTAEELNPAKKAFEDAMATAAKKTLTAAMTGAAFVVGKQLVTGMLSSGVPDVSTLTSPEAQASAAESLRLAREAASYMFPKPKNK